MGLFLVTGAAGFVGTALCRRLVADDFPVRGIVRDGTPASRCPGSVEVTPLSIQPDSDWRQVLEGVDTVVHMAARVHVMHDNTKNPLDLYRQLNVESTKRLAIMAAEAGTRRLIYISSIKVLGEETSAPYSEDALPNPSDSYGVSKWEAEQALLEVAHDTGLEVSILRPPLIYGPGVKANFYKLLEIISSGMPLPFASINNRRSLLYLENLVDAIIKVANHSEAINKIYNISDGEDVSTSELVRRIAEALRVPVRLFSFPPNLIRMAGRITGKKAVVDRLLGSLVVDNGKICRDLDWQPPFKMKVGLETTARWFRDC